MCPCPSVPDSTLPAAGPIHRSRGQPQRQRFRPLVFAFPRIEVADYVSTITRPICRTPVAAAGPAHRPQAAVVVAGFHYRVVTRSFPCSPFPFFAFCFGLRCIPWAAGLVVCLLPVASFSAVVGAHSSQGNASRPQGTHQKRFTLVYREILAPVQ